MKYKLSIRMMSQIRYSCEIQMNILSTASYTFIFIFIILFSVYNLKKYVIALYLSFVSYILVIARYIFMHANEGFYKSIVLS